MFRLTDPGSSEFLAQEVRRLIELGWHVKGKYGPLCCIVDLVGPHVLLQQRPDLPAILLNSLAEQTLASYVRTHFILHTNVFAFVAEFSVQNYIAFVCVQEMQFLCG